MTTPRPRPPAPADPALLARITDLENKLARLTTVDSGPSKQEFEQALTRLSAVEQKAAEPAPLPEPVIQPDSSTTDSRIATLEDQMARGRTQDVTPADIERLGQRMTAVEQRPPEPAPPTPPPPTPDTSGTDTRLSAVEDQVARIAALGPTSADLEKLGERLTAVETGQAAQADSRQTQSEQGQQTTDQLTAVKGQLAQVLAAVGQLSVLQDMVNGVARDVADLKAGDPSTAGVSIDMHNALVSQVEALNGIFNGDATLFTAKQRTGMSIADAAIVAMAASKLTGDVATAQLTTNLPTAWNTGTGYDIAKLTVGAVSNSQMAANAVDTTQIVNSAVTDGKITSMAASKLTGDFALGAGQKFATYGATAPVQQTSGANITNSVTSGGVNGTINDISTVSYAADAGDIRSAIYQLARSLKITHDAMRVYGLLT